MFTLNDLISPTRSLHLNREEALLLLLALQTSPVDLGDSERTLCAKVGELCRAFLREDLASQIGVNGNGAGAVDGYHLELLEPAARA